MKRFRTTNLKGYFVLKIGEGQHPLNQFDFVVTNEQVPVADVSYEVKTDRRNNVVHLTKRGLRLVRAELKEME